MDEKSAEDVSNGGGKKRKRYHAAEFKARYKPQQVRVETCIYKFLSPNNTLICFVS